MSLGCNHHHDHHHDHAGGSHDKGFARALWIALILNALMFFVELSAGFFSQSLSLQADALDFFGDSFAYMISLFVLSKSLQVRAKAALFKGFFMAAFGLYVLVQVVLHLYYNTLPDPTVMTVTGLAALLVNIISAVLLYTHRKGDSNRSSVWICSRNDAFANIAVVMAASGVFYTNNGWPDLLVAVLMSCLALWGSFQIIRQALQEGALSNFGLKKTNH